MDYEGDGSKQSIPFFKSTKKYSNSIKAIEFIYLPYV